MTVGSRYWDHYEPGEVVKVDGAVVHVEVGGGVLRFDADSRKIIDSEWGSGVWIETPTR